MEEMKKNTRGLFGLIGGICLLLFLTVGVYAADCCIEVQLEDLETRESDWENVTLALYDVGDVSAAGEVSLDPVYGISEYPQTADASQMAVIQIEKKLTTVPLLTAKTDRDGKALFSGIERGIYLIRAVESSKYGKITSALVHLPYYEVVDDVKKGPLFTVRVKPKGALPANLTPSPEAASPSPTITPAEPAEPGGRNPESHSDAQKTNGAKTGDESQLAGLAILLILSGAAAGMIIRRRRKVSE